MAPGIESPVWANIHMKIYFTKPQWVITVTIRSRNKPIRTTYRTAWVNAPRIRAENSRTAAPMTPAAIEARNRTSSPGTSAKWKVIKLNRSGEALISTARRLTTCAIAVTAVRTTPAIRPARPPVSRMVRVFFEAAWRAEVYPSNTAGNRRKTCAMVKTPLII